MALHKDNYFSLTKSERRATLLLLVIVLLLIGARVVQQHRHNQVQEQPTEEYSNFQSELKEFNLSLQEKENPKNKKEKKSQEKKEHSPKELTLVPRDE